MRHLKYVTYLSLVKLQVPGYIFIHKFFEDITQSAITCSNLTVETLEQSVKYVQS